MSADGCRAQRLGGCETRERAYGLAAMRDSVALAALAELMAPGMGPKSGPHARALGADSPFFAQAGAVDSLPDGDWVAIAEALTARIATYGIHLAERSLLRHTTGPCFPPHHIDFRGVADSAAAQSFLADLPQMAWEGFAPAARRSERRLLITAGLSLQQMDVAVDLE
ncbi:MAG: hypothetical protein GF330_09135 [Candidatus Eisenbacteria bacterium]|nr:hypothetical protein [Candidatus Eisenbacteria bacterium]